eukprot:scaffold100995_cov23-Tisochrysis_lutea.AAC.2
MTAAGRRLPMTCSIPPMQALCLIHACLPMHVPSTCPCKHTCSNIYTMPVKAYARTMTATWSTNRYKKTSTMRSGTMPSMRAAAARPLL